MARSRLFAALAGLVLLGACATVTPYQAATDQKFGYTNQQVEDDRWQVSFAGNSLTDRQTVETYLLYRAAELTRQQGYDHFRVVQRDTEANRRVVPVGFGPDPYFSHFACDYRFYGRYGRLSRFHHPAFYGYRSRHGFYDPFWGHPYDYREIIRYEASSEILMGKGPKPDDPAYFDAQDVLNNLGERIQRPEVS
ncbi:hypothetical protein RYZ27_03685 [Hyphomonas sp. FCG-A18]|jgi:hypothetical protein|uniref:CC0125/CC1285 family lipoprotein n=1 Tax=Hyphomonas sp. FCG-A18 TaxID=3080019 RepID=UPI002B2A2E41|nr:hypothetical protein RYZ27_03685 [Hyphomonas sp. FCG-A18]